MTEWADSGNSNPLADIALARELMEQVDWKMLKRQSNQIAAVNRWWLSLTKEEQRQALSSSNPNHIRFIPCPQCGVLPLMKDGSCSSLEH